MTVEEKTLMMEMQKKLELIESKLNYFIGGKSVKTGRHSQPILDTEESKFLSEARDKLYGQFESPSEALRSYRSSLHGEEESTISKFTYGNFTCFIKISI